MRNQIIQTISICVITNVELPKSVCAGIVNCQGLHIPSKASPSSANVHCIDCHGAILDVIQSAFRDDNTENTVA